MFRFAMKNLWIKKAQLLLVTLSVVISAGVALLSYNVSEQVRRGITQTAGYYSVIVGPGGSASQLAMNTMYFTDKPLGTLPYETLSDLQKDSRVTLAVPFAMADTVQGYGVVGTSSAFLSEKPLAEGQLFRDGETYTVVLGANAASALGKRTGDTLYSAHSDGEEHKTPLTVAGVLAPTHTVYDNEVFTYIGTLWGLHGEEAEEEHEAGGEEHLHNGSVCAILLKAKNPAAAMQLTEEYDGKIVENEDGESRMLQAIEPMSAVRGVLEQADTTRYLVFALCGIILLMNLVIIAAITMLNTVAASKEIALMRLIGIGMKKINGVYLLQNAVVGGASCLLAVIFSRLCLLLAGDFVAAQGVVLNPFCFFFPEALILLFVLTALLLPTFVSTQIMGKKNAM
ncbi:MAG: hypothetical protein MJ078_01350 [Clostridia bacterium]|nr:hypothetical protein [Clostridia bacterium]